MKPSLSFSLGEEYALGLHDVDETRFLGRLSNGSIALLDKHSLKPLAHWTVPGTIPASDLKVIDHNSAVVSSPDGVLRGIDLRQQQFALELRDNENMPLLSVAAQSNEMVATGSELVVDDAKIKMWDLRSPVNPLFEIVDSIADDVTQLYFHPMLAGVLVSGSTDGLVCLFDTRNYNARDDGLVHVINSESSVSRIGFFGEQAQYMYLMTHIETLSLWGLNQADKLCDFGDVRNERIGFIIDCAFEDDRLFLYSGNNDGLLDEWNVNLGALTHSKSFVGNQSTVRCILKSKGCLIAGSEDKKLSMYYQ